MTDSTVQPLPQRRFASLDIARGIALVAMASFHLCWDLEFFGYLEPGTVGGFGLKLYARSIASTFLILAGISLVLGHTPVLRPRPFLKRFLTIAGAAALISLATWWFMGDGWIFFGILHAMAAASLIGLLFLRLPAAITALVGIAAIAAPLTLRSSLFDAPWLWWLGLSEVTPHSNDYVPVLPWLGPFLLGMAAARLALSLNWFEKLPLQTASNPVSRSLAFGGRNSLIVYLIHQPILIACVWTISQIAPPTPPDPVETYLHSCQRSCTAGQSEAFCTSFCSCTLDRLMEQDLFDALNEGKITPQSDSRLGDISFQCTQAAGMVQ